MVLISSIFNCVDTSITSEPRLHKKTLKTIDISANDFKSEFYPYYSFRLGNSNRKISDSYDFSGIYKFVDTSFILSGSEYFDMSFTVTELSNNTDYNFWNKNLNGIIAITEINGVSLVDVSFDFSGNDIQNNPIGDRINGPSAYGTVTTSNFYKDLSRVTVFRPNKNARFSVSRVLTPSTDISYHYDYLSFTGEDSCFNSIDFCFNFLHYALNQYLYDLSLANRMDVSNEFTNISKLQSSDQVELYKSLMCIDRFKDFCAVGKSLDFGEIKDLAGTWPPTTPKNFEISFYIKPKGYIADTWKYDASYNLIYPIEIIIPFRIHG